jgi:hypothetical protein
MKVPEDSKVGLSLQATGEVRDLSVEQSRMVLEREPELLHQYLKWRGMTRTTGRLIVINQQRVAKILSWLDSSASTVSEAEDPADRP